MPIRPRRIVADMLLVPARQISNPIALLIEMVVNDLAGSALGLRVQYATCTHCTLFIDGVPKWMQKPELREKVPFGTGYWKEKKENGVVE